MLKHRFGMLLVRLMRLVEERGAHPVTLWTLCKNPDMNLEFMKAGLWCH